MSGQVEMREYLIQYKIGTYWTALNETAFNHYTEIVEATSAKEAVRKEFSHYNFSNPNKSIELISIKRI